MKLQVERDQLAEAVAWTARALPTRPTAPVLAGMRLHAGEPPSRLSTTNSAQATVPVITDEEGTVLGVGPAARRDRQVAARQARRAVTDGTRATLKCGSATFTLVLLPEEEYPTLPEMPPLAGRGQRRPGHRDRPVATAAGRDDSRRADRNQDRDHRRHAHPGRHRQVPAGGPRAALEPGPAGPVHRRARSRSRTRRHRTRAHRRGRGGHLARRREPHRLCRVRAVRPRPGCCPASTPSTPPCCLSEFSRDGRSWRLDSFAEAVKSRGAGRRVANTPVRLAFSAFELLLEAGAPEEAQATEIVEAGLRRRGSADCLQPAVPAGRHRGDRLRHRPDLIHLAGPSRPSPRQDRARARLPLRAHADPQRGIGQSQAVLSICALDSAGADGLSVLCGRQY